MKVAISCPADGQASITAGKSSPSLAKRDGGAPMPGQAATKNNKPSDDIEPKVIQPESGIYETDDEETSGKILDKRAMIVKLNEFYQSQSIRELAVTNYIDDNLFTKAFIRFRRYCYRSTSLPPELHVLFCDIIDCDGQISDLFPFFLSYAREAFPHLECHEKLRKINGLPHPWYAKACSRIYKLCFHVDSTNSQNTSNTKQVVLITLVIISLYAFMIQNKPTESSHMDRSRGNEIKINLEQVNRLNLNYPGLLTAKQLRLIKARIAVMKSEVSILMLLGKTRDSHCKLDPTFCVGQTIANVTQLQFGYIDASDPYLNSNELKNELGKALDNYKNPVIIDSLEQLPGTEVMSLFQFIDKDESHQRRGMLILIVYTGNYQIEAKAPTEGLKEADLAEKVLLDRWSYSIPRDSLTSVLSRMSGSIVKVH